MKPNLVINAAAYNNVDGMEEKEEEFIRANLVNAQAVGYLADACLENNIEFREHNT